MGHIRYASDIGAPVEVAFTYTDNHLFVPDWMFGIAAFDPVGDSGHGEGAIYAIGIRLGWWHLTAECEITEYRPNAVIGYTLRRRRPGKVAPANSTPSTSDTVAPWLCRLTLQFDPLGYGRTVLTSRADYPSPGGLPGRLAGGALDAVARFVVLRSEAQLRSEIEEFHGTDLVGRIA